MVVGENPVTRAAVVGRRGKPGGSSERQRSGDGRSGGRSGKSTNDRRTNYDASSDELYNTGPSTFAHARLVEQLEKVIAEKEELQRCIAVHESQAIEPQPDSVVPGVEELQKVVKCLTPEDKIVQICFDEVFTNNQAIWETDLRCCKAVVGVVAVMWPTKEVITAFISPMLRKTPPSALKEIQKLISHLN
uniref:Uncharacterized protein n=1 Tax=Glossina austeni TaxID=7395 RepID=A0A1A9V7A0_GLOAU